MSLKVLSAVGFSSNRLTFTYYQPPTLVGMTPAFGPPSGGTRVVIIGQGFADHGGIACSFDGVENPGEVLSTTEVACVAPAAVATGSTGLGRPVPVLVTVNGLHYGRDAAPGSQELSFEYVEIPVVSYISPATGPTWDSGVTAAAGLEDEQQIPLEITVHGAHFANTSDLACRFGKVISSAGYVSTSEVRCSVPPLSWATGTRPRVSVATNGVDFSREGHALATFRYVPVPKLFGVSPTLGPTRGGTALALMGEGFLKNDAASMEGASILCRFQVVELGRDDAEEMVGTWDVTGVIESDGAAYCRAPSVTSRIVGRAQASVRISCDGGRGFSLSAFPFLYYPEAIVSSISPPTLPASTGAEVMASGEGFLQGHGLLQCVFSGVTDDVGGTSDNVSDAGRHTWKTPATWLSRELLRCPLPTIDFGRSAAVALEVRVTNNGADASTTSAQLWVYLRPEIMRVHPTAGPRTGGTLVTINVRGWPLGGSTDLLGAASCQWGDSQSEVIEVSADGQQAEGNVALTCISPPMETAFRPNGTLPITGEHDGAATLDRDGIPEEVTIVLQIDGQEAATARDSFAYYAVPVVLSAFPPAGTEDGGTEVDIKGSGFSFGGPGGRGSGGAACMFGNMPRSAVVVSDSTLRCTSPPWTGPNITVIGAAVEIRVSLNGGADFGASSAQFIYFQASRATGRWASSRGSVPSSERRSLELPATLLVGIEHACYGIPIAGGHKTQGHAR